MASATWRGDDPGFQTQAVGNYPAKSDVADKDNIFLTDQGWVYRHFKSLDKSTYWDEIICAGDVTNPPVANDPVDAINDPTPEFLVGDGFQFVSGDYPAVDATIGAATITAATHGDTATAIPFTVAVAGTLANNNTFTWSVTGPGTAVISAATGTFTGNTPAQANTNITFPTEGQYQVTCLIKATAASASGSIATQGFGAEANVANDTIGTVTVAGQATPQVGSVIVYSASHTGTAPQGDITYTWTATPNSGVTIAAGDAKNETKVTFTTAASVTSTGIKCVLTDGSASDSGANDTLTVVPHFVIGTPTITGPSTSTAASASTNFTVASYTGASNPAANDLTYQWSATPSAGVTFSAATAATTTVTVGSAGTTDIKCVVSSAKSEPGTGTSTAITLTAS